MELNDIIKLMQTFGNTELSRFQYSEGGASLLMEKAGALQMTSGAPVIATAVVPSPEVASAPVQSATAEVKASSPVMTQDDDADFIKAPMVGVFYPAPSPDAPPYVQLGQKVVKGQTLCILEAMKVMNEIQAEWDGVVISILVEPEDILEYGQPMFHIRRSS